MVMYKKINPEKSRFKLKLLTGLGPVTSSLPMRCATTCATAASMLY